MKNLKKATLLIAFFLLLSVQSFALQLSPADKLIEVASKEVGVSRKNNPERVLWYLESVNIHYMTSYCAAFVRRMMDESDISFKIRSGLARKYVTKNSIKAKDVLNKKVKIPKAALVIWYQHKSSFQGHIGITRGEWFGKTGKTIEGNTSDNNSREGGNVELKIRNIEPYNYFRIEYFTIVC